ncbi:hypothetical protein HZR84_06950 [Hyphobacterium sp. CCMP332]|nr:hypothetical protein HZR84_06950 [Hyphobacterium sp. CCMP332]
MKKLFVFQLTFIFTLFLGLNALAQEESADMYENEDSRAELQNFRYNDQRGLNVFEAPKDDTPYRGFGLRIGGDFALQYQGISQSSNFAGDTLLELGSNFNLPTANLNIDAQLYDGVRLHLRTYLSSRHHEEAWVKGGYIRIDKLDFIKEDFLSGFMDMAFIKVGMDEINYGDVHFRRSDNARTIFNPFVGNYIMDAFTTEPFLEVNVMHESGILGVVGASNGRLNQNVVQNNDEGITFYGKLGYDKQMNDDLRLRFTGSFYTSSADQGTYPNPTGRNRQRDYLYAGDRSGARYYGIMESNQGGGSDFDPRFSPGWKGLTAFQVNPFVKFKGLEFFGVFEMTSDNDTSGGSFTQLGAELLYRFGGNEQFYVGGRYNSVSGDFTDQSNTDMSQTRINAGAGWFITRNMLAKIEYVTHSYDGSLSPEGAPLNQSRFDGATWDGIVLEAAISF